MQVFSRSKTIFVEINKVGRNYLPFIKELEDRDIKYIDILSSYIDYDSNDVVETLSNTSLYLTLVDKYGKMFIDNLWLTAFTPGYHLGMRQVIGRRLVLQNCFFENAEQCLIGGVVAITFYWDDTQYSLSAKNATYYKETVELLYKQPNSKEFSLKIKFPDIRTLAGKRIRSIRPAYWAGTATSPLGYPTISAASSIQKSIYLTLANGSNILIDSLDLNALIDVYALEPLVFENILVNFPDCYLELVMKIDEHDTTITPNTIYSIPLIIEYMED